MCLEHVTTKNPKIAKEDIECYKVVTRITDSLLRTPYMKMIVKLGETYTSHLSHPDIYNSIDHGLHAFTTLKHADHELNTWIHDNKVIVKCIIPKGSKYYMGTYYHGFGKTAIVADTLRYVELLNEEPCVQ